MFVIRDCVRIQAPVERCFGLSTSLAIVQRELRMHPVAGMWPTASGPVALRTAGLVGDGARVGGEGWQLGLPQYHVSLIREFEANRHFQDKMIAGRFRFFEHEHSFRAEGDETVLDDEIRFALPFGVVGWVVGRLFLYPHIRRLLGRRFRLIKRLAEGEEWREYLPG
jgi:ligand-binding SRPBCC domain-containing protein